MFLAPVLFYTEFSLRTYVLGVLMGNVSYIGSDLEPNCTLWQLCLVNSLVLAHKYANDAKTDAWNICCSIYL